MTIDEGIYYLLVRPIVEVGVNSTNASVSITSIAAQCVYWDELKLNWSDYGCRVCSFCITFLHLSESDYAFYQKAVLVMKAFYNENRLYSDCYYPSLPPDSFNLMMFCILVYSTSSTLYP